MGMLEKLKDLVAAMEQEKSQKEEIEEPPEEVETSQEEPAEDEVFVEEEEVEELPEYLECSDDESQEVSTLLAEVKFTKVRLAELVFEYERRKNRAIEEINVKAEEFYDKLESLRLEYGIPREGYSVQLPSSQSNKVSFIKKD